MARFRLRFLLQELDLNGPEVVIGRSPECQITIEDPLVSRQHAKIQIEGEGASIADLGSRNGVRVNGCLIQEPTRLENGDRLRLGTQELVFLAVDARASGHSDGVPRATGFMHDCEACGLPFPAESGACPHCGAASGGGEQEDTITGIVVEPSTNWTFQLLGDVIERALAAGRAQEAERMLRRAANEVNDRNTSGSRLDHESLSAIASFAIRLAKLNGEPEWLEWALVTHREHGQALGDIVLDQLEVLDWSKFASVLPFAEGFLLWWESELTGGGRSDAALSRFRSLVERSSRSETR